MARLDITNLLNEDAAGWQQRLDFIVQTMRELSQQTDPEAMVSAYAARMGTMFPDQRLVSLSRRGHTAPEYRVTRDTANPLNINPWTQREQLPVYRGGLFAELLYGDEPRIIDPIALADDDPAAPHLAGAQSLLAVPLYDGGAGLNMAVIVSTRRGVFQPEKLPEMVWMSNLFGRATHNLVLSKEVEAAYREIDEELQAVAEIQHSLLPPRVPEIPNLELATHYRTSRRAGGDYYDFFELDDGRCGILIADVSGHGTPAAVLMAITHTIAHLNHDARCDPGELLHRLNETLTDRYTQESGRFVTAFYGVYDPAQQAMHYASAGHPAPRVKAAGPHGGLRLLNGTSALPLGIERSERYASATERFNAGDRVVFFTDGITEAFNHGGDMFGTARLDAALAACGDASCLITRVTDSVDAFAEGRAADDDQTLVTARIT
jgi:phosphoserine phosphatase RsbU/P